MKRVLYHGSNRIIESPVYGFGNVHNDYGLGFYTCSNEKLASEWACRINGYGFVNEYTIRDDHLKILDLTKNKEVLVWLNLLIHHRSSYDELKQTYPRELEYLDKHYQLDMEDVDVVIGYRGDDSYFRFPISFLSNEISYSSLNRIYEAGHLGKQYVLISKRAFSLLHFVSYKEKGEQYKRDYYERKSKADHLFQELILNDHYSSEEKILDLIKNDK